MSTHPHTQQDLRAGSPSVGSRLFSAPHIQYQAACLVSLLVEIWKEPGCGWCYFHIADFGQTWAEELAP